MKFSIFIYLENFIFHKGMLSESLNHINDLLNTLNMLIDFSLIQIVSQTHIHTSYP